VGGAGARSHPQGPGVLGYTGHLAGEEGVLGTFSCAAGSPNFASPGPSREEFFFARLFGDPHRTLPQVIPRAKKDGGIWKRLPRQLFPRDLLSHAVPCSTCESLATPRTWPASID
jgi:hypothetical protein